MQKKAKVVIGEAEYSIGDETPDGFIAMKPQMVWLDAHALLNALRTNKETLKRTYGENAYQDLSSFCVNCLAMADRIAVKAVAYKEVTDTRFAYRCSCLCGESEKLYTFSGNLLQGIKPLPRIDQRNILPLAGRTPARTAAFA